jgi:hypothetical protein
MARNNFLEQIQRARAAAEKPREATEQEQTKPIEEMSDEELSQAERAARRRLLDLQHAELRERETARAAKESPASERAAGLAGLLGGLQKHKRRTWR